MEIISIISIHVKVHQEVFLKKANFIYYLDTDNKKTGYEKPKPRLRYQRIILCN